MKKIFKLYKKANDSLRKKKFWKALGFYRRCVKLAPDNPQLQVDLAFAYLLVKGYNNAIEFCNRVLQEEPINIDALNILFFTCDRIGRYDDALRILKMYINNHPITLDKLFQAQKKIIYFKTRLLIAQENPIGVYSNRNLNTSGVIYKAWTDLLAESGPSYIIPLHLHYEFNLSNLINSNKNKELLKYLIEKFPSNSYWWYRFGEEYHKNQDYQEAIRAFEKSLEINSNIDYVWSSLGKTYFKLNQLEKSINACKKATEFFPENGIGWLNLGLIYMELNQYNEAIDALTRSTQLKSRIEQVIEAFNRMSTNFKLDLEYGYPIDLDSDIYFHKFSWYNLALAYYETQRYEEALDACKNSLKIDYKYVKVYKLQKKILKKMNS
ncbi:MAG: tetratricopeptide repeat protein [Promethearchaeota archaeon]|jgi:tetratricopeptide (TPR) repeat protein